jgi:hypothetical protein
MNEDQTVLKPLMQTFTLSFDAFSKNVSQFAKNVARSHVDLAYTNPLKIRYARTGQIFVQPWSRPWNTDAKRAEERKTSRYADLKTILSNEG